MLPKVMDASNRNFTKARIAPWVCLSEPLSQAQDSFVDIVLKFNRGCKEQIEQKGNL
jgi:hypothetical protein